MTASHERFVLRALLVALLMALACGERNAPQEFLWLETFEEVGGDGLPSGWERLEGSPGAVSYVETSFHPGEHGLRLEGTAAVRGPGSEAGPVNFGLGSLAARFIARCDAGASIEIVVGLSEVGPDGEDTGRIDMTTPTRVYPPATWSEAPDSTIITSESAFVDAGLRPPLVGPLRITSVLLAKSGPGACELAELIIDDTGSTTRLVSDGC